MCEMIDKQEWIMQKVSDLMYEDEFMEFTEAVEKATLMWYVLEQDVEEEFEEIEDEL